MTRRESPSFEEFYERTKDRCLRAFLAIHPDAAGADDLLAEAFARALERWDTVRSHPKPEAWVLRTATNLRIDQWRRASRALKLCPVPVDTFDERLDPELVAALRGLSQRQREVVALRVLLDLSTQDTAEALGVEPSTVPVHLRRALAALRTRLTSKEHPHERA